MIDTLDIAMTAWHAKTSLGSFPPEAARRGTWFLLAREVFNYAVASHTFSSSSGGFSFLDAKYFQLRYSPASPPAPALAPPMGFRGCSPIFPEADRLAFAMMSPYQSANQANSSPDTWVRLFRNIFSDWLGYSIEVPMGSQEDTLPISTPATYQTDIVIDPSSLHLERFPLYLQEPSEVAVGALAPYAFSRGYASRASSISRPFYGVKARFAWNPTEIDAIASACSSRIMASGALMASGKASKTNAWSIFAEHLVKALNSNTTAFVPTSTQAYSDLACVSLTPMPIIATLRWF